MNWGLDMKRAHARRNVGVVLLALSLLAAACGDDDDDTSDTSAVTTLQSATTATDEPAATTSVSTGDTEAPTDMDPNGILKFGTPLISGVGIHFDPIWQTSNTNHIWGELIFGTLARFDETGSVQPWMAEELEVVDPKTVRIKLRPGMTFTDGSAFDAEAVAASLTRVRTTSATPQIQARKDPGILALDTVDVIDPLTVQANLAEPLASLFLDAMAMPFGFIVSPKQLAEAPDQIDVKPIGAGPYVLEEFVPDQVIRVRKNSEFWDADSWKLAGVDFVHTPNGPPQTNGLLSDTIDLNRQVPISDLAALETDDDLEMVVEPMRIVMLLMCGGKPPFDNPLIRQAMMIGIDRQGYIDLVYDGLGAPAYGMIPESSASFDPALKEQLKYDPDKARDLVTRSGVQNPAFDLITITTHNWGRQVEALQAQLAKIGITANIVRMDDVYTNWIAPQASGALIAPIPGNRPGGYIMFRNQVAEGGSNAYCGISDPDVVAHINEAVGLSPDSPAAIAAWREANAAFVESAYHIPVIFEPYAVAVNTSRVGGTPKFSPTLGDLHVLLDTIYMKK